MLKKILRASSFIFLSIFIAAYTLISEISPAQATQIVSDNNDDNSMGIVLEEKIDAIDGSKASGEPDLGDDQAFHFLSFQVLVKILVRTDQLFLAID